MEEKLKSEMSTESGESTVILIERDEDSALEIISDTDDWPNWNGNLNNPNDSDADCAADDETDIEHNNAIKVLDCQEQQNVSATPNVCRLVQPTRKSKRHAGQVFIKVNTVKMWGYNPGKTQLDRIRQWFTSCINVDGECQLQIYNNLWANGKKLLVNIS
jgi:hypothetical protein